MAWQGGPNLVAGEIANANTFQNHLLLERLTIAIIARRIRRLWGLSPALFWPCRGSALSKIRGSSGARIPIATAERSLGRMGIMDRISIRNRNRKLSVKSQGQLHRGPEVVGKIPSLKL